MLETISSEKDCDVLIVGAGCTGLYAALLLSSMNISVTIIDKRQSLDDPGGTALHPGFFWSPRTLQILHTFDLAQPLIEIGQRHWMFETFTNKGHGSNAFTSERQQHRVWENDATDFSCSLSCKRDQICAALSDALERKTGISVLYNHELVDLEGDLSHVRHGNELLTFKSHYVLGADGINSFVRQKLGIAYQRTKSALVYYTLEATVHTNFPGVRSMSTVTKDQNAIFIIGHRDNKVFIMFEHNPKWSRLTIDDDVPVTLAQRHIRSILEPYQIEFGKIHAYYRWSADERIAEEVAIDRRTFLLGSAAQSVSPPGMFTSDLGIEQAHNLCWKLCLCLKHHASAQLLDTFDTETRSKRDDMSAVSKALLQFIHHQESFKGLNSTPNREVGYQLQRNKLNLLGESPYHANLINLSTVSTTSFHAPSIDTLEAASVLFERTQAQSQPGAPGAPGTLAQNARLKPYTLYDLLMSSQSSASNDDRPPKSSSSSNKQHTRIRRPRSNSSSGWLAPFIQSVTKRSSNDQKSANRASLQPTSTKENGSSTSHHHQHASRHGHSSIPLDRWRSIKTNYYQLLDRILFCGAPASFIILVFCGSLADRENLSILQKFRRHLEEPQSFVQQYEPISSSRLSIGQWSNHPRASVSSSHRSSSESTLFSLSPPASPITLSSVGRTSLDHHRLSLSMIQPPSSSSTSLFSFMYITASSKAEALQFLTSTKPALVHATFPMGLERVYIDHDRQSHTVFGIKSPSVIVVRPDGYIGASFNLQYDKELEKLDSYFDAFLRPPIDMTCAAALAADYYDL